MSVRERVSVCVSVRALSVCVSVTERLSACTNNVSTCVSEIECECMCECKSVSCE